MSSPRAKILRIALLLGVMASPVIAVVVIVNQWPATQQPPESTAPVEQTFPIPTFSETRYRNTGPDARYVGSTVCAQCHQTNHKSYLLTAHSRALSDVAQAIEPPDGTFEHKATGRSYRVYRKDGQLRHEEVLRTNIGQEIDRIDLPVRYLVGSGSFCRTYLVEVDGFLHESPITWYATKKIWNLSPGYDGPQHSGFERQILIRCALCHAGHVEQADGAVNRLTFFEKAIGCENCHGPGSLHADLHRTRKLAPGEEDLTIVHPGKLPRSLQEAVCAACHLGSPAAVTLRGRQAADFRPGRPLSDYRVEYRADAVDQQMTVVGHIEQLRLSACYQKSQMTCITCHDPHRAEQPKDVVAFYKQKCLDCHARQPCKLAPSERLQKQPGDNCVACHMPRGDTDVPHVAFTHHRIGRHVPHTPEADRIPVLVAADDESRLSPADRQRNLGLAYLEAADKPPYDRYAAPFWERAREQLEAAYTAGLRDCETLAGLAEYYGARDLSRAMAFARLALEATDITPEVRARSLRVLAQCHIQTRNFDAAIAALEELVRLRRYSDDWRLLGMCYLQLNQPQKSLLPLRKALTIRPFRPVNHLGLADAYRLLGDTRSANDHREKAKWLSDHRQD